MTWPDPYQRALFLIRTAAWMVPLDSRAQWQREWSGELHYALRTMRDRGEESGRIVDFARGAFHDAAWHRLRDWNPERMEHTLSRTRQSAGFCLAALGALIALIAIMSGFLPETRAVLLPLPYAQADRIATVTQGGSTLAVRSGIHQEWAHWWRSDSRLIENVATYSWTEKTVDEVPTLRARVSEDFFPALGVPLPNGRDCVLLSHDFWRRNYAGNIPATVTIDGRHLRVVGILDRKFWFLTRRIGVWEIVDDAPKSSVKTAVLLRLKPDVSTRHAEAELESILQAHGVNAWSSLISISPVKDRVRSVFGSFTLALILAVGTLLPAVRLNFTAWTRPSWTRAFFFFAKTALSLLAVLLAGLEFTRATSITMLGGTDLASEPFSTWLFLLGSMGALSWSIYDQRRRCRVCLRRFGLAAQIGCRGCVLLSWSGTELVCLEGHGTLHVPEMASSWQDREKWTALDDSLLELFTQGR